MFRECAYFSMKIAFITILRLFNFQCHAITNNIVIIEFLRQDAVIGMNGVVVVVVELHVPGIINENS